MDRQVEAGVLAVVENGRRQVLFVRPEGAPEAGGWRLPAGALEPGEAAAAAVTREVAAASGIHIGAPEFLGVYELLGASAAAGGHRLVLAFSARTYQEVAAGRAEGAAFLDPQKLPLHLWPMDMQVLTDAGLAVISLSTIGRRLEQAGIQLARYGVRPLRPLTDAETVARRLRGQ